MYIHDRALQLTHNFTKTNLLITKVWHWQINVHLRLRQRCYKSTALLHQCYKSTALLHQCYKSTALLHQCYKSTALLHQCYSTVTKLQHCNKATALLQSYITATKLQRCYKATALLQSYSAVQHCNKATALLQSYSTATKLQHCYKDTVLYSTATKLQHCYKATWGEVLRLWWKRNSVQLATMPWLWTLSKANSPIQVMPRLEAWCSSWEVTFWLMRITWYSTPMDITATAIRV